MAKFKLTTRPRYWWQIVTHVPSATKAGQTDKLTFQVEFEPLTSEESKEWEDRVARESPNGGYENDLAFLVQVTKNWGDVVGEDDQPVEFSEETFRQALQFNWFRVPVLNGYYASLTGNQARLGN